METFAEIAFSAFTLLIVLILYSFFKMSKKNKN